ncbi:hypothetical protein JZ751_003437 [Albula glossodonta]|uniref:Uncharacterized protein n=1 Tax=Albula glossodonta TaxID=121402 RepID=A0A8T2NE04_9TELE|nr:hypothetical protein JZ751_003437 [Albula glossodonta]
MLLLVLLYHDHICPPPIIARTVAALPSVNFLSWGVIPSYSLRTATLAWTGSKNFKDNFRKPRQLLSLEMTIDHLIGGDWGVGVCPLQAAQSGQRSCDKYHASEGLPTPARSAHKT